MAEGFDKVLDTFADGLKVVAKESVTKTADRVFKKLVELTPVATGRARDGWFKEARKNGDVAVVNEVPYIVRLEEGYSGQAPRGMVKVVVAEESMK